MDGGETVGKKRKQQSDKGKKQKRTGNEDEEEGEEDDNGDDDEHNVPPPTKKRQHKKVNAQSKAACAAKEPNTSLILSLPLLRRVNPLLIQRTTSLPSTLSYHTHFSLSCLVAI